MTYCAAVSLDAGMVFASDSRTNAGVDQVASFRKMHVFANPGDRVIVLLAGGNLSISQGVVKRLSRDGRNHDQYRTLMEAESMNEVAELVGDALRAMRSRDGKYLEQSHIDYSASFIVGGQIAGGEQRLFHVYSEGNFIEATRETPYFQLGESKYGKPVIDRVIKAETDLLEATKCLLVSFDSTMRSNVSVGLPIDVLIYKHDSLQVGAQRRVTETDPYFTMIHQQWGDGLRKVFAQLPNPEWPMGTGR
ncbi:MAG: proteasome-type protease [Betaproteobacteria bacterium]|nr:proteasome-type protease [Betaproteobacteria bacterium]